MSVIRKEAEKDWKEKFKEWEVVWAAVLLVVGVSTLGGVAIRGRVTSRAAEQSQQRTAAQTTRFELLQEERQENTQFQVWHDREAGTEIVCARGYDAARWSVQPNCWTTGRSWKGETPNDRW